MYTFLICSSTHPIGFHDYATPQSLTTEEKLAAALEYIKELEARETAYHIEKFGLERISGSAASIKFYTGFPNYAQYLTFFRSIEAHAVTMITWSQMKRISSNNTHRTLFSYNCKLHLIDRLFMYLHKIRVGSLDQDLADKFNVSPSTVSRNNISWSNFLYCLLGAQSLWPTKEQVTKSMPDIFFMTYPNVRVILDCTEIKIQRPSSLVLNSECYSHYKSTTTLKALIGITPCGIISFISSLYSGSISDNHLTKISGLIDLLEPGDDVMVDKGFTINKLLQEKGCNLVIPHFLEKKGQFTRQEIEDNQRIGNVRVHVERAIKRVREFHIFDSPLPLTLMGSVNQIWTVCCLLCNFQGPLSKEKCDKPVEPLEN